jgi:dethiobiotin synthetase
MKKIQIINGVHTGVGKTFTCCKLLNQGIVNGKKINYLKPIISGFDLKEIKESDVGKALLTLGLEVDMENAKKITKIFLKEPTSPNIASLLEKVHFEYKEVLDFCIHKIQNCINKGEEVLIEMAGGICSPITNSKTMLDLTTDLCNLFQVKTTLVTSNYLGSISHTISACKLFNFDEIIWNVIEKTKYDDEVFTTIENFLGKKLVPLGGLEPPRA